MEVRAEGDPAGAEPCDVGEVPGSTELGGQPVVAYRTSGLPYAVSLTVTRHEERAMLASAAQHAQLDLVVNREGKAVGDLVLGVQNNERQFLGVWLPRGAQLWATFVRGLPVKPSGENEWVMIPIPRSTIGDDGVPETIPVEVIYYQDVPRIEGWWGEGTFDFPRVDLLVYDYSLSVWAPEEFRYFAFEGDATPDRESVEPARLGGEGEVSTDAATYYRVPLEQNAQELRAENGRWATVPESPAAARESSVVDEEEAMRRPEEVTAAKREATDVLGSELGGDVAANASGNRDDVDRMAGVQGPEGWEDDGKARQKDAGIDVHRTVSGSSRGLLPIRVSVPRTGVMLHFSRSLVEAKDRTEIGFRYQGRPVLATFPWLRALAGLLLAFGLGFLAHRSILRRRFAPGIAAPAVLGAGLALMILLAAFLRVPIGGSFWALGAGLFLYAAIVAGVLVWRYAKQQRLPWHASPPPPPDGSPGAPAGPADPPPPPSLSPPPPVAAGVSPMGQGGAPPPAPASPPGEVKS